MGSDGLIAPYLIRNLHVHKRVIQVVGTLSKKWVHIQVLKWEEWTKLKLLEDCRAVATPLLKEGQLLMFK
jgi:hypothetical protein